MSEFIYQIERNEKDSNIEIVTYSLDNDDSIKIKKDKIKYQILMKKKDFETLNIKSDNILLADEVLFDKNNDQVAKIQVNSRELHEYIANEAKENNFVLYEADLPLEHRYLIDNKVKIGDAKENKNLKYLSIDIETIGNVEEQEIVLISSYSPSGLAKVYSNTDKLDKAKLKGLQKTKFEDFDVEFYETEKEMLEAFLKDVVEFKAQIIVGWNVVDFDFKVIKERLKVHGIEFKISSFEGETKLRVISDFFKTSTLSAPGVVVFDVIALLKMNFINFDNYKLDTVAREVLGDSKIELENDENADESISDKINAIEFMFKNDPKKLIDYNFKDSLLTSLILEKLELLALMYKRSTLTNTPLEKVKSPIATLDIMYLEELHKRKLVADSNFNFNDSTPIAGAYVIDPKMSFYNDVFVCDFKSLYPSIIMTFNIDPFTFGKEGILAPNGATFSKEKGILPELIEKLYDERDRAKLENDKVRSFALKTTMNSFYGAVASIKSRFYNKDVGEAITSFGRKIIQKAEEFVNEKGHNPIYGDSVVGDTMIWIRRNNTIDYVKISDLFKFEGRSKRKIQDDGSYKYYKILENIQTLTMNDNYENVWKPLSSVMKHKTKKKLFKLFFNNKTSVTVTEDHSLIDFNFRKGLELKKPNETNKGIFNYGFENSIRKKKDHNLAIFLGFWIGDGYLDKNGCNIGISAGKDVDEVKNILKNIPILNKTKFYVKENGDINFSCKKLHSSMQNWRFKLNSTSKTKRIPQYVFEQDENFILNFIKGLFSSDGTIMNKGNSSIIRYTSINFELIKDIQKLLMQVGIGSTFFKENNTNKYLGKDNKTYSHHLVIVNKKLDFFMSNIGFVQKRKNNKFLQTKRKKINVKHIVKKEIIKTHNEEVYDLSVEDTHRFYGNNILLKNTDSIFIKADKEFKNLDEKKKFGKELEAELNKFFNEWVAKEFGTKSYLTIELEKIYSHFFIATKKRYVGYNELSGETIFVGMEAIRGDWTPLAQKFQREIVSLIFADKEKTEIEEFVSSYVDKLKKGELDDLLIYSKKITKPLNQYTKMTPPHVRAARELGDNFSGRTVRYVLTLDGPKHVKLTDENVKYDYEHYIDKQLKGVSDDLLNTLGVDFEKIVFGKKQSSLDKFF